MQNLLKTENQNVEGLAQQTSNKKYLIIAKKKLNIPKEIFRCLLTK